MPNVRSEDLREVLCQNEWSHCSFRSDSVTVNFYYCPILHFQANGLVYIHNSNSMDTCQWNLRSDTLHLWYLSRPEIKSFSDTIYLSRHTRKNNVEFFILKGINEGFEYTLSRNM